MKKACLAIILLLLSGCTSASPSSINASDDLHCAVVLRTLEKDANRLGAPPDARKGLYVLQTWYFSKIERERLVDAQGVVEMMKRDPSKVVTVGKECSNRAFGDPDFPRWKEIASDDFEQKGM